MSFAAALGKAIAQRSRSVGKRGWEASQAPSPTSLIYECCVL